MIVLIFRFSKCLTWFYLNCKLYLAYGGQQPNSQFSPFILNLLICSLSYIHLIWGGYTETWADVTHRIQGSHFLALFSPPPFLFPFLLCGICNYPGYSPWFLSQSSGLSVGTSATLHHIVTLACPQVEAAKMQTHLSYSLSPSLNYLSKVCLLFFLSLEPSVSCFSVFILELIFQGLPCHTRSVAPVCIKLQYFQREARVSLLRLIAYCAKMVEIL